MPDKSYHDLVREAKTRVREVSPRETMRVLQEHPETVLIDCREPNEFALGYIPGALLIPRGVLEQNVERAVPRDRPVILYCASGNRSALAAEVLHAMGYLDAASMSEGIRGWVDAGGPIEG
jgi:rhodanese-related sulfurtransferase